MKKFLIVLLLVLILGAISMPFITGMTYGEIYDTTEDICLSVKDFFIDLYENIKGIEYYDDIDLEVAQNKNSNDNGTIKAREALEIAKRNYAGAFNKVYFTKEKDSYIYKMQKEDMYMAVSDIVVLVDRDYYEVILFKDNTDEGRKIINTYYVDSYSGKIYEDSEKPTDNVVREDDGLGFKIYFPKVYDEYILMDYHSAVNVNLGNSESTSCIVITFLYVEDNIPNELFNLLVFDGEFEKKDFNSDNLNTYYIGTTGNKSYVIMKADVNPDYFDKAKKLMDDNFEYIVRNIEIY